MVGNNIVRVVRVLEYVGPLDMVQKHLGRRLIDSRSFNPAGTPETTVVIREMCCGWLYPVDQPYEIAGYHKPADRGGGAYPEDDGSADYVLLDDAIAELKNKESDSAPGR